MSKYEPLWKYIKEKDESKLIALKKIDRKAKLPANIFAYSFGIIMSLVLGIGMCLSMKIIGMILGIIIGVIGIVGISLNYPIYKKILENSKNKYSYDIIKLASEVLEEN